MLMWILGIKSGLKYTQIKVLAHLWKVILLLKILNMKMIRTSLTCIFAFAALSAGAQKIKVKEGSLDALKGTNSLKVSYDYSGFKVGKKSEAEYIAEKKAKYNKDEAGRGDTWEKSWVADREARYQVQFKEEFEKQSDIKIDENSDDKYTLVFKTTFLEPGYNIAISRKNAEIDGEAWIVETANPSNVIAKLSVENCPGRTFGGYDYDSGARIQEAYAVAGKGLGKYLKKAAK